MVTLWLCLLAAAPQEPAPDDPVRKPDVAAEAKYVDVVDVPLPRDVVLEVGGLVLRDKTMFVATRRGEIWRLENVDGDARATLWAEGLQEPLGLLDRDGWLYCAQRGELSRLRDRDGDGRMDELETVADGWPLSGNYHEYAFGPTVAGDGSFWLTLNKPFGDQPFGKAPWRGWAIRIPAAGGSWEPVCAGLRSPCGVGTAPDGSVWYTDNQGEWCATNKFAPLQVGDFHGHPWGVASCKLPESKVAYPGKFASGMRLADAARTIPHFTLPAVWIPYDLCGRSAGGFVWDTEGHFGPFRGQVFCGDQFSSEVFRMTVEKVGGAWQGACYPFRAGLKCGITRVHWGTRGTLWCGLTNRGWGSHGDAEFGLQRLVWRGIEPFELAEVAARPRGFALRFTQPIDPATAVAASVAVRSWTYDHHEDYGCKPRDERTERIASVELADDGRALTVSIERAELCRVYEIQCSGVRSAGGEQPWHGIAWYTRNRDP